MGRPLWLTLGLLVAAAIGAVAFLAKVWRVTPDDGGPVYRVSLLDKVQSAMLHRRAMEHAARGDDRVALQGLRGAVANNPGDPDVLRDWVRLAVSREDCLGGIGGTPLAEAFLLLRVGRTNMSDLDLTMGLLWKLDMRDEMLRLGEAMGDGLGARGAALMARAYFDSGDMGSFDQAWRRHGASFESDMELRLRREAWKAQWGPPATAREGMARLAEAQGDPATRRVALELGRKVAVARADAAEHERLLRMQMADGTVGTRETVEWWLLLASTGRLEAARRAARESGHVLEARSAAEARTVATALLTLGMAVEAVAFLESASVARHQDAGLWLLRADGLKALGRWEDLGAFAAGLIQGRGAGRHAEAVGMVLRAVSEAKLGQLELARATVRGVMDAPAVDGATSVRLAGWLGEAGLPKDGLALLRRAEAAMANASGYWAQRTLLAGSGGEVNDMVESSRRALALAPGDPRLRNNHATALLAARREPAEAVQLTLQNVHQSPLEPKYWVNHALALLANDRVPEARMALDRVATATWAPEQEANLHLAWVEVLLREGRVSEARQRAARINRSLLMPFQAARLDDLARRL